jgi:hypothetical protein
MDRWIDGIIVTFDPLFNVVGAKDGEIRRKNARALRL